MLGVWGVVFSGLAGPHPHAATPRFLVGEFKIMAQKPAPSGGKGPAGGKPSGGAAPSSTKGGGKGGSK